MRGKRVRQVRRFLIAQRCLQRVGLRVGRESQVLLDQLADFLNQCVETRAFFVHDRRAAHERHEGTVSVFHAHSGGAFTTLNDDFDLAVLLFLRLENAAERSDAVDLLRRRLVHSRVVLSSQKDRAIAPQSLFQGSNRTGPTDFEGDFSKGKYDDVADWHHWVPGYVCGGSV